MAEPDVEELSTDLSGVLAEFIGGLSDRLQRLEERFDQEREDKRGERRERDVRSVERREEERERRDREEREMREEERGGERGERRKEREEIGGERRKGGEIDLPARLCLGRQYCRVGNLLDTYCLGGLQCRGKLN